MSTTQIDQGMEEVLNLLLEELRELKRERANMGKGREEGMSVDKSNSRRKNGEMLKLEGERAVTNFLLQLKNLVKAKTMSKQGSSLRNMKEINKLAFEAVGGKGKLYEKSWGIVKEGVSNLAIALETAVEVQTTERLRKEAEKIGEGMLSCKKEHTREFMILKGGRVFIRKGNCKVNLDNLGFLAQPLNIDRVVECVKEMVTGKDWKQELQAILASLNKNGGQGIIPLPNPNPEPVDPPSESSPMIIEGPQASKRARNEPSATQPTLFNLGRERSDSLLSLDGVELDISKCILCKWKGYSRKKLNGHIQSDHQIGKPTKVVGNPFRYSPWQGLKTNGLWECPYCEFGKGDGPQSYIAHMSGVHRIAEETVKPFLAGSSTNGEEVESEHGVIVVGTSQPTEDSSN